MPSIDDPYKLAVLVENLTTGQAYRCDHSVPPDHTQPVYLSEDLTLTVGFDPMAYPGPLQAAVGEFSLFAATAADVPAWRPGHVIRITLLVRDPLNQPADWWTHDPDDPDGTGNQTPWDSWERWTGRLERLDAAPHPDGVRVRIVVVDYLTSLTGQTITAELTNPFDQVHDRLEPLFAALRGPTTPPLFEYPGTPGSWRMPPVTLEGAPIIATINDVLAGSIAGNAVNALAVMTTRYDAGWFVGLDYLASRAGGSTPYRLVMVGTEATRADRPESIATLNRSGGAGAHPETFLVDACLVPLDGLTWSYSRGTNGIRFRTIKYDGTEGALTATIQQLVDEHGAQLREIATQNPDQPDTGDPTIPLRWYLGDASAATPRWTLERLTVPTDGMSINEAGALARAQRRFRILDTGDYANLQRQVTIVNAGDTWRFPGITGDVQATVARQTYRVAGGRLTVEYDLSMHLLEPEGGLPYAAATYDDLAAHVALAPVRYTDTPAGSPHIDPDLTYYDMRLIGV